MNAAKAGAGGEGRGGPSFSPAPAVFCFPALEWPLHTLTTATMAAASIAKQIATHTDSLSSRLALHSPDIAPSTKSAAFRKHSPLNDGRISPFLSTGWHPSGRCHCWSPSQGTRPGLEGKSSTWYPQAGVNIPYVNWFREAWPYIQGHRGSTFVVVIPGEVLENRSALESILQVSGNIEALQFRCGC